jgi:hypothetical protein
MAEMMSIARASGIKKHRIGANRTGGAKINSWDSLTVKAYKLRLGQGYSHEAAWNRTQNSSDQENRGGRNV